MNLNKLTFKKKYCNLWFQGTNSLSRKQTITKQTRTHKNKINNQKNFLIKDLNSHNDDEPV